LGVSTKPHGPIGDFLLTFVGRYTKFENFVPDSYVEQAFPEPYR
jgi:hypothetical protein